MIQPQSIFTPAHPATEKNFIHRQEVKTFSNYLGEMGSQILVFGRSGVGKTSLVINSLVGNHNYIRVQCNQNSTYESIISFFKHKLVGIEFELIEKSQNDSGGINIGIKPFKYSNKSNSKTVETYQKVSSDFTEIDSLISAVGPECWKLVIDDFEKIHSTETKEKISNLLKSFSDQAPRVISDDGTIDCAKIIIIGIAKSMQEILSGDPSNMGRVMGLQVNTLTPGQSVDFITTALKRLKIGFYESLPRSFAHLADGYPRYLHALGLAGSRLAIERGKVDLQIMKKEKSLVERDSIFYLSKEMVYGALIKTIERYQGTYDHILLEALGNKPLDNANKLFMILCAHANVRRVSCSHSEIMNEIKSISIEIKEEAIKRGLRELTKEKRNKLLYSTQRGQYAFTDDLFKSYLRMKYSLPYYSNDYLDNELI